MVEDSDVTELTFAVPPVTVKVVASTSVTGPAPVSATVSGRDASVRFDAPLDASFAPSAADFAVLADGRRLAVTGAWTAGRALLLELAEPATGAVRLAYVPSAAAPLGGRDGSAVSPFETLALAVAGGPADDAQDTITLDAPKLEGAPGLEAALADALRHAPGPVAATFAAPRRAVADLSALSALPELRRVNLAGNAVTDAGPLALLADLERLDLSGNAVAGPVAAVGSGRTARAGPVRQPRHGRDGAGRAAAAARAGAVGQRGRGSVAARSAAERWSTWAWRATAWPT